MPSRTNRFAFVLSLTLLAVLTGVACSDPEGTDEGSTGTGGSAGTDTSANSGGLTGSGGASAVPVECSGANVTACGGDIAGDWKVGASCMTLSGDMDVALASLGCVTVPVSGTLEVSGTLSTQNDGSFVDNTTTVGSVSFPLEASCLTVSSVPVQCEDVSGVFESLGWTTATCTNTNGACSCSLTVNQAGGLGAVVPSPETSGQVAASGTTFSVGAGTYAYCAAGGTLSITPQMPALKGQFVLVPDEPATGTGGQVGTGGAPGTGGMPGTGGADAASDKPCDIFEAAGNTCVAAHSTVRALFADYSGPLYQVKRADEQYKDIPVLSPGGVADATVQDEFCGGSSCTIWRLYDQSGHDNFLEAETPNSTVGGNNGMTAASATAEKITINGYPAYSLYTRPNQAYWKDGSKNGMPVGAEPQGIYMVTSGEHYNGSCCYNYGNGQLDRLYHGGPMMDALYFGDSTIWGHGSGPGPWVMADMEDGMLAGGFGDNDNNTSLPFKFVTAMEKNDGTSTFALKGGDATQPTLTTMWDGALPGSKIPMKKEGAIVLGSGGDCCLHNNNLSEGTFYEGAIVAGYPSNETDQAVHANIVEAGYGK